MMATTTDTDQPQQRHRPLPVVTTAARPADAQDNEADKGKRAKAGKKSRGFSEIHSVAHGTKAIIIDELGPTTPNCELRDVNLSGGEKTSTFSFSQRVAQIARTPTPLLVQGDNRLLRDIDRAPPGDPPILRPRRKSLLTMGSSKTEGASGKRNSRVGEYAASTGVESNTAAEHGELARKRSQYFEDAFSSRDTDTSPAKERVRSEAPVLADVRTNVLVGDEFTIITELSAHLAVRYRRPLSSVVVTLQHGQCLCFGGSFDPAYVMSVFALPSQLQPTTNKRNAALIQKHMEDALGVPTTRGHLRFVAVPETNLAYGGKTTVGHVEDLARSGGDANGGEAWAAGSTPYGTLNGSYKCNYGNSQSPVAVIDTQNISSGPGSRKYKTARKLSVKGLSSSFRSPSPSRPEITTLSPPQPPPHSNAKGDGCFVSQQPSPLPAIPERSPGEDQHTREKGDTEDAGIGGRIIAVADGAEALPPASPPQPNSTIKMIATASTSVARQPSRRARRTKSFVATLFGRSSWEEKHEGTSP